MFDLLRKGHHDWDKVIPTDETGIHVLPSSPRMKIGIILCYICPVDRCKENPRCLRLRRPRYGQLMVQTIDNNTLIYCGLGQETDPRYQHQSPRIKDALEPWFSPCDDAPRGHSVENVRSAWSRPQTPRTGSASVPRLHCLSHGTLGLTWSEEWLRILNSGNKGRFDFRLPWKLCMSRCSSVISSVTQQCNSPENTNNCFRDGVIYYYSASQLMIRCVPHWLNKRLLQMLLLDTKIWPTSAIVTNVRAQLN